MLAINLLIGKKNARTDKVSQGILPNIPEFATVDLLSSYSDYLLGMFEYLSILYQACVLKFQSFNCSDLLNFSLERIMIWEPLGEGRGFRA